jgi:hypothetical protein
MESEPVDPIGEPKIAPRLQIRRCFLPGVGMVNPRERFGPDHPVYAVSVGGGRFALSQVNLRTDRGILRIPGSASFPQEIADRLRDRAAILDLETR